MTTPTVSSCKSPLWLFRVEIQDSVSSAVSSHCLALDLHVMFDVDSWITALYSNSMCHHSGRSSANRSRVLTVPI